jgi:hypothetical protein
MEGPVGEGYASPIFASGRILQFARQGDDEVAMSLDPENGKILWRRASPAPFEPVNSAARHGKGPKSMPLYYDGKLYAFGAAIGKGTGVCLRSKFQIVLGRISLLA